MKITPAHDFNDYEVGKRHALPMINILTFDGDIRARRCTTPKAKSPGFTPQRSRLNSRIWSVSLHVKPLWRLSMRSACSKRSNLTI
ncbi:hypothetical protein DMH27_17395 [Raoultella planticola]|nr:hypothetical protein [Raoultella planticola]